VVKTKEILTQLEAFTKSLPPLTVADVEPMDIAALRAKVSDAHNKLQTLQASIAPLRFKGFSDTLISLSDVLKGYRQLALELKPECLDFEGWHEYTEDEDAPALVSRCFGDSQSGRQILPLQFLPLSLPMQEQ